MSKEVVILVFFTAITVVSLCFVPKEKTLQAHFIFLFGGLPTWILGLMVVQFGWIEYPVREFHTVNRTSFLFEYLVLPVICVLFNVFYPSNRPAWLRLGYYFSWCSVPTAIEFVLERTTLLIQYIHWEWYWTWISIGFILWLSRKVTLWFFRSPEPSV